MSSTPDPVTHPLIHPVGQLGNYPVSGNAIAREFRLVPLAHRPGLLWRLEREREQRTGLVRIGNWLCMRVEGCTCGPTDYGTHEPACGYAPVRRLDRVERAAR